MKKKLAELLGLIDDHLNAIPNNDVRKSARAYFMKNLHTDYYKLRFVDSDVLDFWCKAIREQGISEAIDAAFYWSKTKEGWEFWHEQRIYYSLHPFKNSNELI